MKQELFNKMVCDLIIKQMEEKLGRKLTEEEKRKVKEKAGHVEIEEKEELEVYA